MYEPERRAVHPDVERLTELIMSVSDRITDMHGAMPDLMRQAIHSGIKDATNDKDIMRSVYENMTKHASSSFAEYIGRRVITAFAVLAVSAALAWAFITGQFKQ